MVGLLSFRQFIIVEIGSIGTIKCLKLLENPGKYVGAYAMFI
jgi:hypothetical protein